MTLPVSPIGFAVEETTGVVHHRWADHARGLRRTTQGGVLSILGDREPILCPLCWPPGKKAKRVREVEPAPALAEVPAVTMEPAQSLAPDLEGGS